MSKSDRRNLSPSMSALWREASEVGRKISYLPDRKRTEFMINLRDEIVRSALEDLCQQILYGKDWEWLPRDILERLVSQMANMRCEGTLYANDGMKIRRLEAILLAAKVDHVPTADVAREFDAQEGVDIFDDKETGDTEIIRQPKKWAYL